MIGLGLLVVYQASYSSILDVTRLGDKAPMGHQIRWLTGAVFCHFNTRKRPKMSQFLDFYSCGFQIGQFSGLIGQFFAQIIWSHCQ
jgi:hypothetical protein